MVSTIIDQAKLQIETKVTAAIGKLAVLIPLLVAFGFATGAAYIYLEAEFGALSASLLMAAAFVVLAIVVAVAVLLIQRNHRAAIRHQRQQTAMAAGLTAAAPVALTAGRGIVRTLGIKAPLLITAIALVTAILANADDDDDQGPQA